MFARSVESLRRFRTQRLALVAGVLALLCGALPSAAQAPAASQPAAAPKAAAPAERCSTCHADVTAKRYLHPSLVKNDCTACHKAQAGQVGKCRS